MIYFTFLAMFNGKQIDDPYTAAVRLAAAHFAGVTFGQMDGVANDAKDAVVGLLGIVRR